MSHRCCSPFAFVIYLALVAGAVRFGPGCWPGRATTPPLKSSTYCQRRSAAHAGGRAGLPAFFVVALFFAMLHLGVLMLGSSDLSPIAGLYLVGLILALVALILG